MSKKNKGELGGVKAAADILSHLDSGSRERILADILRRDPDLGRKLQQQMTIFDDLAHLPPREMQELLRDIPKYKLALAMRKCGEEIKAAIFAALSPRAADALREDIEGMGKRRLSEVEAAQAEIVEVAKRLESEGRILVHR